MCEELEVDVDDNAKEEVDEEVGSKVFLRLLEEKIRNHHAMRAK